MYCIAIDPGPTKSGIVKVAYNGSKFLNISVACTLENDLVMEILQGRAEMVDAIVIEEIESYGMPVGREVFQTVFFCGRIYQLLFSMNCGIKMFFMPRRLVKKHHCGDSRAKDANIRAALIERYGPVGTKKNMGPLYGVKGDAWAALALGTAWIESQHSMVRGQPWTTEPNS